MTELAKISKLFLVIDPDSGYHDSMRFRRLSEQELNPSPQFRNIQRAVGETPYLSPKLEHGELH